MTAPRAGRPTHRLGPLAVGLIAIAVMAAFSYLTFAKRIPLVHGYRVKAEFTTSNQVRKGSPVRIAGVTVGKVVGISNSSQGAAHARVLTLELGKAGQPLHTDARAKIRPRVFLEGGFFVEIDPGSPSAPTMPDGGTIPVSRTAVPVQFQELLRTFDRPTRDSLVATVKQLSEALDNGGAQALGRTSKALVPALADVAVISEALQGSKPHDASQLVGSAAKVTAQLAANDAQLGELVDGLARSTAVLADREQDVSASLRELDGTLTEAPAALTALDRSLPATRRFAANLQPSLRSAPTVLRDTAGVVRQLQLAAGKHELPALVDLLVPGLRELPRLESRLTALFPVLKPITDCVTKQALPVLTAKIDDGNLSTGYPVWLDLAHAAVGLASASQDFDANGPYVRYLTGIGAESISTGNIPGIGSLVGRGQEPILGASPVWLGRGVKPPFRPDAACSDQAPVNLQSRSKLSVPISQRHAPFTPKPVTGTPRQLVARAIDAIKRSGK